MLRTWCLISILWLVAGVSVAQEDDPSRSYAGFIESEVSNLTPFVGEPIVYTFRFYFAGLTENNEYTPPDFLGFGQRAGSESRTNEVVDGEQFIVFTETTVLIPTRPGVVTISPAYITVPEVNRPRQKQSGHTLETPPITVNVQAIPADIPPEDSGAVGQFAGRATIVDTTFRAGEPFLLRLSVEGSGNFEQSLPPALDLPETWRHFARSASFERTGLLTGTRIFEWFVIPDQPGQQVMPPIRFTYFDPQIGAFQTLVTDPIDILVDETFASVEVQPTVIPTPTFAPSAFELRPMSADIRTQSTQPGQLFWMLWFVPPVVTAGVWLVFRDRKEQSNRMKSNPVQAVKAAAQSTTQRRKPVTLTRTLKNDMQLALENPDAKTAFEQILAAVLRYLSRKVGQTVTFENASETLSHLPVAVQSEIKSCLDMAVSGRYAPVNQDDVKVLVKMVLDAMVLLDKHKK